MRTKGTLKVVHIGGQHTDKCKNGQDGTTRNKGVCKVQQEEHTHAQTDSPLKHKETSVDQIRVRGLAIDGLKLAPCECRRLHMGSQILIPKP